MDPRLIQYVALNPTFNCSLNDLNLLVKKFAAFGQTILESQAQAFSLPSINSQNYGIDIKGLEALGLQATDRVYLNFQIPGNDNDWFCAAQIVALFAPNTPDAVRASFDMIYPDGSGDMRATAAMASVPAVQSALTSFLNTLS